jgi:hypothetical protein
MPFENRKNISRIALSPNGLLLLSIDEGMIRLDSTNNGDLILTEGLSNYLIRRTWTVSKL